MDNGPLVSVITPAYNAAMYIRQTLESVQAQTYASWEHIVVDDGSADSTAAIVAEFVARDPRVRLIRQDNGGQAAARNRALAEARGELVAFLDADDLWPAEKLELSVAQFAGEKQDLLFASCYVFTGDGEPGPAEALERMDVPERTYAGREGLERFLEVNRAPILTVVVRREAVMAVGGFEKNGAAEDYQLWLKLLANGYVLRGISPSLAFYRLAPVSVSAADRGASRDCLTLIRDLAVRYPDAADYLPGVRVRLQTFSQEVMRSRDDERFLAEQLRAWGLMKGDAKRAFCMRPLLSLAAFRRKMRRALAN